MNNQTKCQLGDYNEDTKMCSWLNVSEGASGPPQKLYVHILVCDKHVEVLFWITM